jgi:hypothetical protein
MRRMPATPNGAGKLIPPERNHFFHGKLMDAGEFQKDQSYFNHKRSLINRFVLGSGVVCGLNAVQDETPGMLRIEFGLALDASGNEIVVPAPVTIDARQHTNDRGEPEGTPIETGAVEIRLAYAETKADHVPVLVADCDTPGGVAPSTIREGFRILVRQAPDEVPSPPACTLPELQSPPADKPLHQFIHELLCERTLGGAGASPQDAGVRIARVTLANSAISEIDLAAGRQLVYGNTLLYELILCLAEQIDALSNRT